MPSLQSHPKTGDEVSECATYGRTRSSAKIILMAITPTMLGQISRLAPIDFVIVLLCVDPFEECALLLVTQAAGR